MLANWRAQATLRVEGVEDVIAVCAQRRRDRVQRQRAWLIARAADCILVAGLAACNFSCSTITSHGDGGGSDDGDGGGGGSPHVGGDRGYRLAVSSWIADRLRGVVQAREAQAAVEALSLPSLSLSVGRRSSGIR